MVGSVIPSSRFLSKKMLQPIDFKRAKVIIELGPGTGVFTKELVLQKHPNCQFVVIELNDAFFEDLKNELQIPIKEMIIYNRLLWLGVSSLIFGLVYKFFEFSQNAISFSFRKSLLGTTKATK